VIGLRISRRGRGLKVYAKQVDTASASTPPEVARDIAGRWAAAVPVDTGAYRASIYVSTEGYDGYGAAVGRALALRPAAGLSGPPRGMLRGDRAVVGSAVDYAVYVEYGTSRRPARPAFEPAVLWGRRTFGPALQKKLRYAP